MVLHRGMHRFRSHSGVVHWLGYASVLFAWLLAYALVTTLAPLGGTLLAGVGAFAATVSSAIVAGLLYNRAIGTPLGNLFAPFVIVAALPSFVFDRLASGTDVTIVQGSFESAAIAVVSGLVGLFVAFGTAGYGYSKRADPLAWERDVMPLGVRVFDPRPSDEKGLLAPRVESERERTGRLDVASGAKAMAVALALITAVLYATVHYARAPPEQAGGPILLALVYVIAFAYTYE